MKQDKSEVSAKSLAPRELALELQNASVFLTQCTILIETSHDIEPGLVKAFNTAMLQTSQGLTEAETLMLEIESRQLGLEAQIARFEAKKLSLGIVEDLLKKQMKRVVEDHPGFIFRNAAGEQIKVVNNGGKEALKLTLSLRKVSFDELSTEDADVLPAEFVEVRSHRVLNKDAVRAALEAGRELSWATLERGTSLRNF